MSGTSQTAPLRVERKISLSDAVIGIAVTLLILDVKVPEGHSFADEGALSFLAKISDEILVCAITFILVGCYWMQHRRILDHLRRSSSVLAWLNLLFLFVISLLPFSAALLNAYPDDEAAIVLFGAIHAACGLSLTLMWMFAAWRRLTDCNAAQQRHLLGSTLVAPVVCLVAMLLSTYDRAAAVAAFLSIPLWQLAYGLRRVHSVQISE